MAYAWGWPMVNIQSRRRPCSTSPMPVFGLGHSLGRKWPC